MATQEGISAFDLDIWEDASAFRWRSREITRTPLTEVVTAAYADNIGVTDTVVELGSGTGELASLLGPLAPKIHVDGSASALSADPTVRSKEHAFVQADLYQLPFPDGSVDAIVGMLVLDAMVETPAAFTEIERVLKPGGTLLYIHDMKASANGLARVITQSGDVAIPLTHNGDGIESIGMLSPRQMSKFERKLKAYVDSYHASEIMDLLERPPVHFDHWAFDRPDDIDAITQVFNAHFDTRAQTPPVSEAFMQMMHDMADFLGMTVTEFGVRDAEGVVSRADAEAAGYTLGSDTSAVVQTIYGTRYGQHKDLPDDHVFVATQPAIFAASKKL